MAIRSIVAEGSTDADIDTSRNGHGTCVASIAGGIQYGVSEKSKFVVVKSGNDAIGVVDAWFRIVEDIVINRFLRNAVVVRPTGSIKTFDIHALMNIPERWDTMYRCIQVILEA